MTLVDLDGGSETLTEVLEKAGGRGEVVAIADDGLSGVRLERGLELGGVVLRGRSLKQCMAKGA